MGSTTRAPTPSWWRSPDRAQEPVPDPRGLSDAHATFADPLSDAICGHKDIGVGLDDTVAVIGAGPVGTAHAAIARLEGAGQVLMLETAAPRLELARDILGDERMSYVDTSGADGERAVRDATDDIGADVVIVACSSDIAQEQAMEMAAPRGRVLFFGGLPKGTTHMRFPSNILHYLEVQVHGSYASRTATRCTPWTCWPTTSEASAGWCRTWSGSTRPRGLRAHPRRRGAQGRRGAVSAPRRSLRHSIAEGLRERIAARKLAPGDRLPSEPELARSLGVSRSSLRAGSRCSRRTA
jgi:hypothetical protein